MPIADYDRKNPQLLKRIEDAEEITQGNKKNLQDFARELKVQDYSKARIYKLLQHLKKIAENIDFEFEEATEEDIKEAVAWIKDRDLADSTKRDYKVVLKRFYKWIGNGEYPKCVSWINTTSKQKNGSLPEDMLTEEDIQELIDHAQHPRDKALISLLWETGARIGELIDLKVGSFEDHKHGFKVVISGKTGPRRLLLISSVPHVKNWLNSHPHGDDSEAWLWVNVGNTNFGAKMQYRSVLKMLKETKRKSDVDKPVNPHAFRHSRATYLANQFTESQLCEWMGWVQGSDQAQTYVHLSGRDMDSSYARLHGIEEETEDTTSKLAPSNCPRCGEEVPPNADFCHNCAFALSRESFKEVEKTEEELSKKTEELEESVSKKFIEEIANNPELKKLFKEAMKED
ncbi:MAG: tyrosine-type recombinase/integrase [Candidatus Aenigmatarchaeota archaeon]